MNHSFWLIVIFVATLVCNTNSRPQNERVKNYYRVHEALNDQDQANTSRYDESTFILGGERGGMADTKYRIGRNADPVTFVRIDIPHNKTREGLLRSIAEAGSVDKEVEFEGTQKQEVHYVPVSISSKSDSKKKWPSQSGIESVDDLYLYNTYTSSVNDNMKPSSSPNQVVPYISNKKPAIIIIEELTTRRPYYEKPAYPTNTHSYTPIEVITYRPEPTKPIFFGASFPSYTTTRPVYSSLLHPPVLVTRPPSANKPKPSCPGLSISATNTIINNNKEGCNDIKINIESTVVNGASQHAGSATQNGVQNDVYNPITVAPDVSVSNKPEEDTMQFLGPDFGDFLGSMFSTFSGLSLFNPFSITFLSTLFSPLLAVLAGGVGIAALILPCAFLSGRSHGRNLPVILHNRSDKPRKHLYGGTQDGSKQILQRTTRSVLSLPYKGHLSSGKGRRKFCLSYCLSRKSDARETAQPIVDDTRTPETVTKALPNIEAIAVVARATNDRPTLLATQTVPDVVGQMVDTDIRTPPKLKEIIQGKISSEGRRREEEVPIESGMVVDRIEANGKFELPDVSERASSFPYVVTEGKGSSLKRKNEDLGVKGIAMPVLMDDTELETSAPPKKLQKIPEVVKPMKDEKKKINPKPVQNPATTPSSGLSTWILLSDNRESTTVSPKKNNKKDTLTKPDEKKTVITTKKPAKVQTTTAKPVRIDTPKTTLVTKKGVATPKPETRRTDTDNENISALEAMVKNQKKNTQTTKMEVVTTKLPLQKKQTTIKPNRINDRMDVTETRGPEGEMIEARKPSTIPPMLPIATQNPTTVGLVDQQGTGPTTTDPTVESTTKKKKNGTKKKKNKNRRRKPVNGTTTQIEQKNVSKNPKEPPVGAQLYNFLSREIMPTVGLGLVGVLVTAGLAGLLGYNPFVTGSLPVRRTYEVHHGYSPNNYYNYNSDYNDGGQSEEALFREVLSGMPEGSRYGLSNTENSYPESQIYSSQDQVYDAMKSQTDKKYQGSDNTGQYQYPEAKNEEEASAYDGSYSQDYTNTYATAYDSPEMLKNRDNSNKYQLYDREVSASYVYPETSTAEKSSRLNEEYDSADKFADTNSRYGADKISSKYSKTKTDTIERQPEALYRVAGDYDHSYRSESTIKGISSQNSWHRMGSALEYTRYSHLEPGPRSLNFTKEEMANIAKKRMKRTAESVIQRIARKQETGNAEKDIGNEIDFEDSVEDTKNHFPESTTERMEPMTTPQSEDSFSATTEPEYDVIETNPITYNFLDVLKRLAQYKLKIGLSFLRSTTDAFSRYLDVIQKRVDESITNTTLVYRIRRNPDVNSRSKRSAELKKTNKKQSKRKGEKKKESLKKH